MSDTTVATTGPSPVDRPRRRRGLLFPLLLIIVGTLFFAANFGYVPPVSARAVVSLWPLILIVLGIEFIVARRQPYLALALELLVVFAGIAVAVAQPGAGLFAPSANATSNAVIEREGARTLTLRIEGGGGSYSVGGGAPSLVTATATGGEIEVSARRGSDSAEVRVRPSERGGIGIGTTSAPSHVDVRVASDIPTSLRVSVGAGDFTVDLQDLRVRDARIDTGASNLTLTLPHPSGNVDVHVGAGAARVTVVVPEGVEARISMAGGLISTAMENARLGQATGSVLSRGGSAAETPGYSGAKDRVTVTIEAGASSITIR